MSKSVVKKNNSIKQQIIEIYVNVITEFLELLNQNELFSNFDNITTIIYIGLNAINRVFEYVLIKTKNLQKTVYYSQKTYIYYLEYMEQILCSNLYQSLNSKDAILFIYKKTIFDLYDGENNQSFNTMNNIMTLNEDTIIINETEWRPLFLKLFKMVNVLFYWENNHIHLSTRIELCNDYLLKILSNNDCINHVADFLDIIQQKKQFTVELYKQLLTEFIEKMDNKKINRDEITDNNEQILIKLYLEETKLFEKLDTGNMKEFVRWLYLPVL